jgi:hypothetical protein
MMGSTKNELTAVRLGPLDRPVPKVKLWDKSKICFDGGAEREMAATKALPADQFTASKLVHTLQRAHTSQLELVYIIS